MEYKITKDNEIEKEIEFSIPSPELEGFIDTEINKVQRDLTLKGFRKGKVPRNIIRSRYYDTLKAQAMNNLVSDSFLKVLDEKQWLPASQAELHNIDEGENITFQLRFEIIPDFTVDNYLGLEIFREEPLPDDFLLEQGMNELREQHAKIKEVSRPAVVDDLITIDLKVTENKTMRMNQKDLTVKIGDRSLPDEINRALVGVRKSENKEVKVGNQIHNITIKKIEEKLPPQIDDAFAKSLNYENVEQLKKKLTENVKKLEEKRIESELKESLSNTILERTKFNVPKSLIQTEYKKLLQNFNLADSESNKERFWTTAEKRVRLNLILDKIAKKENINVQESEIMNLVSAMGIKLSNDNRKNIIEYLGDILNREKTTDFLLKNAKIIKKSRIISPKEAINDTRSIRR